MYDRRELKFEGLIYTMNRALAARCAAAFANFPVDWVMFYESNLASDYLARERFDFVILDLDSDDNKSMLLNILHFGANPHSIVLAVTTAQVDPATLNLCYASQIFYPVRPNQLEREIYRNIPLAEALSVQPRNVPAKTCTQEPRASETESALAPLVFSFAKRALATSAARLRSAFRMKHSLSIVAQEWTSSVLASVGMIWFGQEVTKEFRGLQFISPPSAGPTYLVALGVLLWLCAKHRRFSSSKAQTVAPIHIS